MKEHKKRTLQICKQDVQQMQGNHLVFFHLSLLFCTFLMSIPLQMKLCRFFSYSVCFLGCFLAIFQIVIIQKQFLLLTFKHDITMQTNAFITSDDIVFKLQPQAHTVATATSDFQRELVEMKCHSKVLTLQYMLSYSCSHTHAPLSMLSHCRHPQVIYM